MLPHILQTLIIETNLWERYYHSYLPDKELWLSIIEELDKMAWLQVKWVAFNPWSPVSRNHAYVKWSQLLPKEDLNSWNLTPETVALEIKIPSMLTILTNYSAVSFQISQEKTTFLQKVFQSLQVNIYPNWCPQVIHKIADSIWEIVPALYSVVCLNHLH